MKEQETRKGSWRKRKKRKRRKEIYEEGRKEFIEVAWCWKREQVWNKAAWLWNSLLACLHFTMIKWNDSNGCSKTAVMWVKGHNVWVKLFIKRRTEINVSYYRAGRKREMHDWRWGEGHKTKKRRKEIGRKGSMKRTSLEEVEERKISLVESYKIQSLPCICFVFWITFQ